MKNVAEQHPEHAGRRRVAAGRQRRCTASRSRRARGGGRTAVLAEGGQAEVGGPVAHEQQHQHGRERAQREPPGSEGRAPAVAGRPAKRRGAGTASCPVAVLAVSTPTTRPRRAAEPAAGDGGAQHHRRHARAGADHDAPQQPELPDAAHRRTPARGRRRSGTRAAITDDRAQAVAFAMQGGGERGQHARTAPAAAPAGPEMALVLQPNSGAQRLAAAPPACPPPPPSRASPRT